ncbi:energy transducer TonB [uncultured Kordia sp.]|uniref:energy transducer TonB n=1 Tax=uncultured Kordia sp. TaxID=507699 RepID=UPI00262BC06C|nr:energy transducer TonB [uncultured Kordia sp.]
MSKVNHKNNVSGTGVRESHLAKKDDLRIQKNPFLRFSVSLMLSLFLVYTVFQVQAAVAQDEVAEVAPIQDPDTYVMEDFRVEQKLVEKIKEPEPKVESKMIYDEVDPVKDDTEIKKEVIKTEQDAKEVTELVSTGDVDVADEDNEEIEEVPFVMIEDAPVFPGCEKYKTKADRKKCMSEKIQKHVNRKFNTDLANDLGLNEGRKRITVLFTIDEKGVVTDIKSRGPHPKLEKEAERVVKLLPKMKPGQQRKENVKVKYTLPINFIVN